MRLWLFTFCSVHLVSQYDIDCKENWCRKISRMTSSQSFIQLFCRFAWCTQCKVIMVINKTDLKDIDKTQAKFVKAALCRVKYCRSTPLINTNSYSLCVQECKHSHLVSKWPHTCQRVYFVCVHAFTSPQLLVHLVDNMGYLTLLVTNLN